MEHIYRITIEAIGNEGEQKFCADGPHVIECDGFAVFAREDGDENQYEGFCSIHNINPLQIAEIINSDDDARRIATALSFVRLHSVFDDVFKKAGEL